MSTFNKKNQDSEYIFNLCKINVILGKKLALNYLVGFMLILQLLVYWESFKFIIVTFNFSVRGLFFFTFSLLFVNIKILTFFLNLRLENDF